MRPWCLVVLLLASGRALAQAPSEQPACTSCEPLMLGAHVGVEGNFVRIVDGDFHLTGASPLLELEVGQWVGRDDSLTLLGGYETLAGAEQQTGAHWDLRIARLGARLSHHFREQYAIAGFGFGATFTASASDSARSLNDVSHYVEGIFGFDAARVGPVQIEILGVVSLSTILSASAGATVGVVWDPPRAEHCAEPFERNIVGAIRGGIAYDDLELEDSQPASWGPWIEGEVGVKLSPRWATVVAASYTKFHGFLNDFYGNQTPVSYSDYRLGVREQLWPTKRMFIASGVGLVRGSLDKLYFDLELGVELVRMGNIAIEATSQGSLTGLDNDLFETSFALGVAWR